MSLFFFQLFSQNSFVEKRKDSINLIDSNNFKKSSNDSVKLEISNKLSSRLYREGKYRRALFYANKEVFLLEKLKVKNKKYTKALFKVAFLSYTTDSIKKSLKYYKKIIELNLDEIKSGQSYCEIGRIYDDLGQLKKSIEYYRKGISILEKHGEIYTLYYNYINLTNVYYNSSNSKYYNIAIKTLQKAKEIAINNNFPKEDLYEQNNLFALFYTTSSIYNYGKARAYNLKNLSLNLKDSLKITSTYNNLAFLYLKEQKDSSAFFIKEGLKYSSNDITKARLYDNYAKFYFQKRIFNESLKNIEKAIEINLGKENYHQLLISENNFIESKDKGQLLYCFQAKSEILNELYKKDNNVEHLKGIIENAELIDKLVQTILEDSSEDKTKLHWRNKASQAYLLGVQASYLLNDKEVAFNLMEKNKSLLLIESVFKNTNQTNLPKSISEKEKKLKKRIFELESKLEKNKQAVLLDSLFNVKQVYQKYLDSIQLIYPKYFKNKLNFKQIKISEIQNNLKKDEIVVSYIWNKFNDNSELAFGLVIEKNNAKIFKLDSINALKANIKTYKRLVSKPFETIEQQEKFQEVSYKLYKQLFPEENIRSLLVNKNIVIVPDTYLQNIPFDALITKENTFDYLLKTSSISYVYSMSFLNFNNIVKRKTSNNFIGYSPVSFDKLKLENLYNTEKEVTEIQKTIGGDILLNNYAKKNHFLKQSSASKIIHLATHADASNNNLWIAFYDEKLELHELYTYKNNADLVVLSACNTSLGELVDGEGVLSLARGFFYSGAKSVVSSLWSINDKSTSFIMNDFYKNIKSGETKVTALNNAKRAYLNSHSLSEKSPYYWSSFVLIGDTLPIKLNTNYTIYYILCIALLLIMSVLFYKLKKK